MKTFNKEEAEALLNNWKFTDDFLVKTFKFNDFKSAFAFMVKVAFFAEIQDHHPNWSNTYNVVKIKLTTHTLKKVTEKDIQLAKAINTIIL